MESTDIKKLGGMLGMAARARKLRSGEFACEESVKTGKALLCLTARDASDRTKKHFRDMCSFRNVPFYELDADKEQIGHMIGRELVSSVTIEDKGFYSGLLGIIEGGNACE